MKKWPDARVASYLKRTFGKYELDHQVNRKATEKVAAALLTEVDFLRGERCELGCRAVNTAVHLLCRWNLPAWAVELRARFPDAPKDHLSDQLLMVGFARRKDPAKVRECMAERTRRGLAENTHSYNLLLKAMQKPDHDGMLKVLKEMAELGLTPNRSTADHALACCASITEAKKLYALNFKPVLPESEVAYSFIDIAARNGEYAAVEELLTTLPRPAGVIQLNKLMNAYAGGGALQKSRALLRQMKKRPEVAPTPVTYATFLKGCVHVARTPGDAASQLAERVFEEAFSSTSTEKPTLNNHVFTKLMEVYAKTGDAARARALVARIKQAGYRMTPPMTRYFERATWARPTPKSC
eukprot:TRINITY_DN33558_c0_g1_i1.p1 TRINITY_DN33558_c0_g1~~TRINITY_DN33558_c0_g1_i1.p1  ORF type:complete len:355 (+),score=66.07 TRINITY_DN33558_c0_g1_i1:65-1129(+)